MKRYLLAAALLLAGCGSSSPPAATVTVTPSASASPTQSMSEWKHSAADEVHTMGDALVSVGDAMQDLNLPAMRVSCTQLATSVDHLERELPSPDTQVNAALQDTIDDFRALSQLCMTLKPSSHDELVEMNRLIDNGGNRMKEAFNLMH